MGKSLHSAYDFIQSALVGNGLPEPLELFFRQGNGNSFGSHFAGPYVSAALLRGTSLEDTAFREEAQTA
jgi:hypothetical protein